MVLTQTLLGSPGKFFVLAEISTKYNEYGSSWLKCLNVSSISCVSISLLFLLNEEQIGRQAIEAINCKIIYVNVFKILGNIVIPPFTRIHFNSLEVPKLWKYFIVLTSDSEP